MLGVRQLEGRTLERRAVELPLAPPPGYHTLRLPQLDGGATLGLIAAPARCHLPPPLSEGGRQWGIAIQLYTLRSRRNWGIGDLTDLADLMTQARALGASSVGINQLHALFPNEPEHASPYTPSSRLQLNPLYLDAVAIPDFRECELARDLVGSCDFAAALAAAVGCTDLVFVTDVPGVLVDDEIKPSLSVQTAQSLIASGTIMGGMVAKLESAFEALHQNVPNPFNPVTTIRFDLPWREQVRLVVFDVSGRLVRVLTDGAMEPGRKSVTWNGRDSQRNLVASGVYFYRLVAGDFVQTKKMVLLR